MRKIYVKLNTLLLIVVLTVTSSVSFAQINSVASGDASSSSTWVGNQVPAVFGGSITGSVTIKSGHTVTFTGNAEVFEGTLTIEDGATLIIYGKLTGYKLVLPPPYPTLDGKIHVEGLLLCSELSSVNEVTGTDTGEIYAGGIGSTVVSSSITVVTGIRIWTGAFYVPFWEYEENWAPDIVTPAPTGVVISPNAASQPVILGEDSVSSFYILNSDGILTIADPSTLIVTGEFSNQGGLVNILSKVYSYGALTGSLIVGNYTGTGMVRIEQNVPSSNWHVISTPMDGLEMGAFAASNNFELWPVAEGGDGAYDFAPYDEANDEWGPFDVFPGTTTIMQPGIGYIARLTTPTEFDFAGNSIFTGTLNLTLNSTNFGWNAVGNPYTSGISANANGSPSVLSINGGSLSEEYTAVYMWDEIINDYYIVSYDFGREERIPVCQGFLVKANADGVPFQFTNGMQRHSNATNLKSAELPPSEIKLFVQTGDFRNSTRINFLEGSSKGFEKGYDVGKLKGNDNIALYSRIVDDSRNTDLGVQSLPDVSFSTVSIPIGLDLSAGGETVFSVETSAGFPKGALIYLEDTEMETRTQLNLEDGRYTVTLPEVYGADRFKLVIENYVSKNTTTNIDVERPEGTEYKVYTRDRNIVIEGESNIDTDFSIYNIEGRLFYEGQAKTLNINEIDASAYPNGIYLLKIRNSKKGEIQTHKVAITK